MLDSWLGLDKLRLGLGFAMASMSGQGIRFSGQASAPAVIIRVRNARGDRHGYGLRLAARRSTHGDSNGTRATLSVVQGQRSSPTPNPNSYKIKAKAGDTSLPEETIRAAMLFMSI